MDDRNAPLPADLSEDMDRASEWLAGRDVSDAVALRRCIAALAAVDRTMKRDVSYEYGVEVSGDPFSDAASLANVSDKRLEQVPSLLTVAGDMRTAAMHGLDKLKSGRWMVEERLPTALDAVAMAFYRQRSNAPQEGASDKVVIGGTTSERLIFIDIDGVLLSFGTWTTPHNAPLWRLPVERRMKHLRLDPTSISLLVRLCEHAETKLVLSSTWRKTWPDDLTALHNRLIEQGLRRDLWHQEWMLPIIPGYTKWQELAQWGGWSPDAGALIIDDEFPPEDAPGILAEQVVILQTDQYEGFGAYNYFDALEIFGVEDGDVKPPKGLPPERGGRFHPAKHRERARPGASFKP